MKARQNPFRSDRVDAFRYQLEPEQWDSLLFKLRANSYRGMILGPHGTGKTVFLEDLRARLQKTLSRGQNLPLLTFQDGFGEKDKVAIREGMSQLKSGDVCFMDGTEWLPIWIRWTLPRSIPRNVGWICTGHRPMGPLPLLLKTEPQPEVAQQLVATLLNRALTDGEKSRCDRLYKEKKGNMRDFLRALYLAADMPAAV